MRYDERMEQEIQRYVSRLRRALSGLGESEVDDIALEIRGHIAECVEGSDDPTSSARRVLEALGDPEELAARYQTEAVLARGRAGRSPLAVLQAVQRWAMEGLFGLLIFLAGVAGYGTAIALVGMALLKPFFPHHVGFWWSPPEMVILGVAGGPPDPRLELLGWWIVPLGVVAGCLLWVGMTRWLGALLRRFRAFVSPLEVGRAAGGDQGAP